MPKGEKNRKEIGAQMNKRHLTQLISEKKLLVQFLGEYTVGQSAYSFITPLVGHFW